jgi:hypothetical protein
LKDQFANGALVADARRQGAPAAERLAGGLMLT